MLVLTRKTGESLHLGDDIEIRIVRIDGDQVRIGIIAPRSIPIVRGELIEEIERETTAAAAPDRSAVANLSKRLQSAVPAPAPAVTTPAESVKALEAKPVGAGKSCRDA